MSSHEYETEVKRRMDHNIWPQLTNLAEEFDAGDLVADELRKLADHMEQRESLQLRPEAGTIVLGPAGPESDHWTLVFTDIKTGRRIEVVLDLDELEEMDGEFTGLNHVLEVPP